MNTASNIQKAFGAITGLIIAIGTYGIVMFFPQVLSLGSEFISAAIVAGIVIGVTTYVEYTKKQPFGTLHKIVFVCALILLAVFIFTDLREMFTTIH